MGGLTVLYDEGCGFCTRLALRVARSPHVEIAPIGSEAGAVLLRDLTHEERYAAMHVVDPLGRRFSGGAALVPLARAFPGGAPLAAVLAAFPGPTTSAYELMARNRAALSRVLRPIV